MFKVNNKDIRTTPMASFYVFIVNFEHTAHLVLVFLLLTLNMLLPAGVNKGLLLWMQCFKTRFHDSHFITSLCDCDRGEITLLWSDAICASSTCLLLKPSSKTTQIWIKTTTFQKKCFYLQIWMLFSNQEGLKNKSKRIINARKSSR